MAYIYLYQGHSAPDRIEEIKNGLEFLARNAAAFPGATRYEYYQSTEDPTSFYFFSIWDNEEDFKRYATSEIHEEYKNALPQGAWAVGPNRTTLTPLE